MGASGNQVVLIVDDDFDIRTSLADVLQEEGFETALAADGFEALEYLRTHDLPGLILLDWMMPRMNGVDFRKEQLKDPALSDVPLVIVSAHTQLDADAASLGIQTFLPKPLRIDRLLEVVAQYVQPRSEKN